MGRELAFDYHVVLGPREEGYCIREQHCGPAPGDTGHSYMCRYMNNAEHLMVAIEREKPLIGHALDEVLTWQRPDDLAGCYCEPCQPQTQMGAGAGNDPFRFGGARCQLIWRQTE